MKVKTAVSLLNPKTMSKFCFLRMPELRKLIFCIWIKRQPSVRPVNQFVVSSRFSAKSSGANGLIIIFGWLYTDIFFCLEHLWFLYISPNFWVDLCHLCFFVVVGIMFPFFLQVLLVVVWFMTIRFLYVLVGPVYLSQA